jgi:hypothetical protein
MNDVANGLTRRSGSRCVGDELGVLEGHEEQTPQLRRRAASIAIASGVGKVRGVD